MAALGVDAVITDRVAEALAQLSGPPADRAPRARAAWPVGAGPRVGGRAVP